MLRLRLLAMLFTLLPVASLCHAQAVKDLPRPTDFVSDDGHVLSGGTIQHIDQLCGALQQQAHAQMAIVTVQNTDGEAIADYAVQLEDAWKVGAKGTDRGVIVLVSIGDRKLFISTGYGLEGVITDAKAGVIAREMEQYLRVSQNDEGVTLGAEQVAGLIAGDAGVSLSEPRAQLAPINRPAQLAPGQLLVMIGIFIFLFFLAARTGMLPFLLGIFFSGGFGGGGGGRGRDDDDNGGDGFSGFGGGGTGGGGAGGSY